MTILLVRHAEAGDRGTWRDPDHLRPLSDRGRTQADRLVEQLSGWTIDRIVTSPYVRCVQTVAPLGDALGLKVEQDERLAEGSPPQGPESLLLDSKGSVTVWCSHGDVIGDLVSRLARDGMTEQLQWQKGSTWVLDQDDTGQVTAARYLRPPA